MKANVLRVVRIVSVCAAASVAAAGLIFAADSYAQTPTQNDSCGALVMEALAATDQQCADTARNHACYGHRLNTAVPRPDSPNLVFDAQGQKVRISDIQVLDLSAFDVELAHWGVILIQAQANLPDTLPGQNVTFVLFGDVEVENAVGNPLDIDATVTATTLVWPRPGDERTVLARLTTGAHVFATGKHVDPDGRLWVRVGLERNAVATGWVEGSAVDAAFARLPDVDPNGTGPRPMQAFYFKTGIGRPACAQAPRDGLVVQSPRGAARVNFTMNGIEIDLGSTAYITSAQARDAACVSTLDGTAVISSGGVTRHVQPGQRSCVPLDPLGSADGAPSEPNSFDPAEIALIAPVLDLLPESVVIPAPAASNTPTIVYRAPPTHTPVPRENPNEEPPGDAPPAAPTNAAPAPTQRAPQATPTRKPTKVPTDTPLPGVTAVITATP